jgi:hypothetical protein
MPWWGNSFLATEFSNAVGYSLLTPNSITTFSAGSTSNMNVGPYFAYNSIVEIITFLPSGTAATYHPNLSALIFSVDVDRMDKLALEFEIYHVPTFVCLKQGKEVDRLTSPDIEKIRKFIENF